MKKSDSISTWLFLIQHVDFSKLLTARFISVVGDQIHTVTTMLLVQKMTNSALALGSVFAANTVPRIIFSLIGGVSVDRYDRKQILVICDIVRAIGVFALVVLSLTNRLQVWHIAVFAALNGIAAGFYPTAISAAVPSIVVKERLQKANAIGSMNLRISSILGSAIGGIIFSVLGPAISYSLDVVSYLLSALIIITMTLPKPEQIRCQPTSPGVAGAWKDFKEGWSYVFTHQALLAIVAISVTANFVSIPVAQLLPSFSEKALQLTSGTWFGLLWSGMAIGLFLSGLFLNLFDDVPNKVLVILLSAYLFGAAATVFGMSQHYVIALISIITMGFGFGCLMLVSTTLFQILVPKEMLGRFFGNVGLFTLGIQPLVMWLAGFVADKSSAAAVLVGSGIFLLICCSLWTIQYRTTYKTIRDQEQDVA